MGNWPYLLLMVVGLGAATLVVTAVTGQAVASIALDHFGWAGFTRHPVTPGRMAGMALLVVGLVLVRRF